MRYYLGIDLGGTNIKAGVVDEDQRVRSSLSVPTPGKEGPATTVKAMAEAGRRAVAEAKLAMSDIRGAGVGAPGQLDFQRGVVLNMTNLPGWQNIPITETMTRELGCPVALENDANAAAFGEFWAGAGKDPATRHLVMLTLGTGIGMGIIIDGRVLHGATGLAGEGGHMIVQPGGRPCNCGQKGCIEAYASAMHTGRRAEEAARADAGSSLRTVLDREGRLTSKDLFAAAEKGDALALRLVDETAYYLGITCVTLCRLLDPQMIVFAGGMILAGDMLFDRIRRIYREQSWGLGPGPVRIVPAELGNDAGFIGAAAVAWDADKSHTSGARAG